MFRQWSVSFRTISLVGLFLLLLANGGNAQAKEPLSTDRPDAAESSQVVGKDVLQIETSIAVQQNDAAGVETTTLSFPTLLRYGVKEWLELRLESDTFTIQEETATFSTSGFSDLTFGAKAHFLDGDGRYIPSFGILINVTTPTGDVGFTDDAAIPELKLLADWELPYEFSLGTNNGLDLAPRDATGNRFVQYLYAYALGHALPVFSDERLGMFIELAGAVPLESGKQEEHFFDSGFTYLVSPDFQIDAFISIGLTDTSDDIGGGLGFSWRV